MPAVEAVVEAVVPGEAAALEVLEFELLLPQPLSSAISAVAAAAR